MTTLQINVPRGVKLVLCRPFQGYENQSPQELPSKWDGFDKTYILPPGLWLFEDKESAEVSGIEWYGSGNPMPWEPEDWGITDGMTTADIITTVMAR